MRPRCARRSGRDEDRALARRDATALRYVEDRHRVAGAPPERRRRRRAVHRARDGNAVAEEEIPVRARLAWPRERHRLGGVRGGSSVKSRAELAPETRTSAATTAESRSFMRYLRLAPYDVTSGESGRSKRQVWAPTDDDVHTQRSRASRTCRTGSRDPKRHPGRHVRRTARASLRRPEANRLDRRGGRADRQTSNRRERSLRPRRGGSSRNRRDGGATCPCPLRFPCRGRSSCARGSGRSGGRSA